MRPDRVPLLVVVAAVAGALGCGLEDGERFGRRAARPGVLRVQILDDVHELDPARVQTPLERALARQLFAALVETGPGGPRPSLASSWEADNGRIVLHLRDDARFTDGAPVLASDFVWSWQRALRPSTAAPDLHAFAPLVGGIELAKGALVRVGQSGARGRGPPYAAFRDGPGDPAADALLPASSAVRVVDTDLREPCCGAPVPLHRAATDAPAVDAKDASIGALAPGEAGVVIGVREIGHRVWVQLRAPGGAAGWAHAEELAVHVPAIGLVHVVDHGGHLPALRTGPDEGAPARALLADDDVVEVVERGPEVCLVIDTRTGRSGWIDSKDLDATVRERRWFLVETIDGSAAGWVAEQDLAFDPGLLDARALDEHTLDVGLAGTVDEALASFADPLLRAVPPRLVEEQGKTWTTAGIIQTSGPFHLDVHAPDERVVLVRSPTSFERSAALVARVELIVVKNRTTALHLYRAGVVDAVLDGALPPDLAPTLARARDYVAGAQGGALIAPEVRGLGAGAIELRGVTVTP